MGLSLDNTGVEQSLVSNYVNRISHNNFFNENTIIYVFLISKLIYWHNSCFVACFLGLYLKVNVVTVSPSNFSEINDLPHMISSRRLGNNILFTIFNTYMINWTFFLEFMSDFTHLL